MEKNQQAKLVIIWDGATYHHSQEFREYLQEVNQGKTQEEWLIRCIKLAPNARLTESNRRCLVTRERNVTQVLESLQEL